MKKVESRNQGPNRPEKRDPERSPPLSMLEEGVGAENAR